MASNEGSAAQIREAALLLGRAYIAEMVATGEDPADAEEIVRDLLPVGLWAELNRV